MYAFVHCRVPAVFDVCLSICLSQGGRHAKSHNAIRSYVSPKLERGFSYSPVDLPATF